MDNPAQLEKVSNCIERCQKLQRMGPRVRSMKPREQLLRDILDDLRWLSQLSGHSTLNRSRTTLGMEDKWSKKKPAKQRRNSETLAKITEEGEPEGVLVSSSTLPRGVAINVRGEKRKVGVLMRSASASATSHSMSTGVDNQLSPPSPLPKKGVASKPINSSPRRTKKRSPTLRRHQRSHTTSEEETSPMLSGRRKNRNLKLTEMKEVSGSLEYAADDEDAATPESVVLHSLANPSGTTLPASGGQTSFPSQPMRLQIPAARTPEETGALVIGNTANISSPFQTKKKVVSFEQEQLVSVEVHSNTGALDSSDKHSNTIPASLSVAHNQDVNNGPRLDKAEFETSITSETCLLPPPGTNVTSETHLLPHAESGSPGHSSRRRRKRSPGVPARKTSLSQPNVRGDDRDWLIELHTSGEGSPYFAWESQPEDAGGLTRKAYSLDRKTALARKSGTVSAQKDDKKFLNDTDEG